MKIKHINKINAAKGFTFTGDPDPTGMGEGTLRWANKYKTWQDVYSLFIEVANNSNNDENIESEVYKIYQKGKGLPQFEEAYTRWMDSDNTEEGQWGEVASKQVLDSDGFLTDYTMYTNGESYIFMFGDKDLYLPDASYADYETENEETAWEWFNSYEGFSDDFEDDLDYDVYSSEETGTQLEVGPGDIVVSKSNKTLYKILKPLDGKVQVLNLDTNIVSHISNDYLTSDHFYIQDDIISSEEVEDESDELDHPDQEFDSAKTSINSNNLPAVYKMISIPEGSIGLDFGGGRWDNAVEHIKDLGATLCVYDPYNRSAEHNREVIKTLRANGGADWAVNSNVLNVIKEPEARRAVLENISKITKSGAPIYITVYEGRGDGKEGQTKSGYQLNRKTQDYLEDIQEVFPDAKRRGKLITAHNTRSANSSVNTDNELNLRKQNYLKRKHEFETLGEVDNNDVLTREDKMHIAKAEYDNYRNANSSVNASTNMNTLSAKIKKAVKDVMTSPSFGFELDEVDEYSVVTADDSGRIEVRAEVDYDGLMDLCEALNPIVEKYDKDSYFEPVEPGIIEAYIDTQSITSASSTNNTYDDRMTVSSSGQKFSVHYNHVDNSPSADARQMWQDFKATVSPIKPYDDADYAWAQIQDGKIKVIQNGKVTKTYYYFDADDMDVENTEWCDEIIEQAIDYISEINQSVEPRMIHNSKSIEGQAVESSWYDVPERPLDPPEEDEPTYEDDYEGYIEFPVDNNIIIDDSGYWTYENNDYSFAQPGDDPHEEWQEEEFGVKLGDSLDAVEDLDELLLPLLPAEPGTYHIKGDVTLVYDISGVYSYYEYLPDFDYDRESYIDDAEVSFNSEKSEIKNFECNKIN